MSLNDEPTDKDLDEIERSTEDLEDGINSTNFVLTIDDLCDQTDVNNLE